MSALTWSIRFAGSTTASSGGIPYAAGPLLELATGPLEVSLDWGAPDAGSGGPQTELVLPDAGGAFALVEHLYATGHYSIQAEARFAGNVVVPLRLDVTVAPDDTSGIAASGHGGQDFLFAGTGGDSFAGRGGDDFLLGMDGDDRLAGQGGDDYISGDAGADTLLGGAGDDVLLGGDGDDVLRGDAGTDNLLGGDGDDRLVAGDGGGQLQGDGGADTLICGSGADWLYYVYSIAEGGDRIVGFTPGQDILVLTFFRTLGASMDASRVIDDAAGMADAGPYVIYDAATGRLMADLDGTDSGGAQRIATLVGAPAIGASDFLF